MKNEAAVVLAVLLVIAIIVAGPLAIIWALNTPFALGIRYTFWTWLAALILAAAIDRPGSSNSNTK